MNGLLLTAFFPVSKREPLIPAGEADPGAHQTFSPGGRGTPLWSGIGRGVPGELTLLSAP